MILGWRRGNFFYMHGIVELTNVNVWSRVRPIPARDQTVSVRKPEKQITTKHAKPTPPVPPPQSGFVQQFAGADPDWHCQSAFAGGVFWFGAAQLFSLIWLTICQAGSKILLPVFHSFTFRPFCNGLRRWQPPPSTTVDLAEMREFIPPRGGTYRPDHGASRGASSL